MVFLTMATKKLLAITDIDPWGDSTCIPSDIKSKEDAFAQIFESLMEAIGNADDYKEVENA